MTELKFDLFDISYCLLLIMQAKYNTIFNFSSRLNHLGILLNFVKLESILTVELR